MSSRCSWIIPSWPLIHVMVFFISGHVVAHLPQGLSYRTASFKTSTIHILTIDPQYFDLELSSSSTPTTVSELVRHKNAIAGVNGGFFTKAGAPASLVKEGSVWRGKSVKQRGAVGFLPSRSLIFDRLSRTKTHLWTKGRPSARTWEKTSWTLGAGPLLIQEGKALCWESEQLSAPFLKAHARTALCETKTHWMMVVADVTMPSNQDIKEIMQGSPLTLLSRLKKMRGGLTMEDWQDCLLKLGCRNALNLDGGSSSSLYVDGAIRNAPWSQYSDPNVGPLIMNAIVVRKRGGRSLPKK